MNLDELNDRQREAVLYNDGVIVGGGVISEVPKKGN